MELIMFVRLDCWMTEQSEATNKRHNQFINAIP